MGMVRRMKTTPKLPIPEGAIKKDGLLFHHDIVSKVKRHKIPDALILNLDQTPSKYVTVAQSFVWRNIPTYAADLWGKDDSKLTYLFIYLFI